MLESSQKTLQERRVLRETEESHTRQPSQRKVLEALFAAGEGKH